MYKIVKKEVLNSVVVMMEIEAPYVAARCEAGQFVIVRVDEDGERIPLTIADFDRERNTVEIIFQVVGTAQQRVETCDRYRGRCWSSATLSTGKEAC